MTSPSIAPLNPLLVAAFGQQAKACLELKATFSALICALIAREGIAKGKSADYLNSFDGDIGPFGASLPLRLLGCLHRLALSGDCPELAECYPPNIHPGERPLYLAIFNAMLMHDDKIFEQLQQAPQTNETARAAVIFPAFALLAQKWGLPLKLTELGASAGLNLNWNEFHYDYARWQWGKEDSPLHLQTRWHGPIIPAPPRINVADKMGCDIAPININDKDQALNLKSYVWAGQPERMERLDAAIEIAQHHQPKLEVMPADQFVQKRLAKDHGGHCHVIYHTIAWQYFSNKTQAAAQTEIEKAGEKATATSPLAWLRMEADDTEGSAGLNITIWDGARTDIELGRADFHGRWVNWTGPAIF